MKILWIVIAAFAVVGFLGQANTTAMQSGANHLAFCYFSECAK